MRTTNTSSGASSAAATSAATGTPPRGSPSTTTSSPAAVALEPLGEPAAAIAAIGEPEPRRSSGRRRSEPAQEPRPREQLDALERARLLEQVPRARHDLEHRLAAESPAAPAGSSSSTASSSPPTISSVGARTEASASSARSGRPPRETTAPTACGRLAAATSAAAAPVLAPKHPIASPALASLEGQPVDRGDQPPAEQRDVEPELPRPAVEPLLARLEQVEQERRQAISVQCLGDLAVAGAVPARAAAVGERDDPDGAVGDRQVALQKGAVGRNADLAPCVHGHRLG